MHWRRLGVVLLLLIGRIVLGIRLWKPGHTALTWDDFSRVLVAQAWAVNPTLVSEDLIWLPFHSWVMGTLFKLFGASFASNPMALAALVNTALMIGAAGFLARTAYDLWADWAGATLVFAVGLFIPWAVHLSLSGLAEPLYYFAVAAAIRAFVAFHKRPTLRSIAFGSLCVAAACAIRYEGWLLAASWFLTLYIFTRNGPLVTRWRPLALAAMPMLVPAWWLWMNAVRAGHPLSFMKKTAQLFEHAYGTTLFNSLAVRATYYPKALLLSEPFLFPLLLALAVWAALRFPRTRAFLALLAVQFVLFYLPSLRSKTLGAFNERFMFIYPFTLLILLGALPERLATLKVGMRRGLAVMGLAAVALVCGVRIGKPPREWSFAPDFLEMGSALIQLSERHPTPLRIVLGPRPDPDPGPLGALLGQSAAVRIAEATSPVPGEGNDYDLWIERLPERVMAEKTEPGAVYGRYRIYGPLASSLRPQPSETMAHWSWVSEDGTARAIPPTPMLGIELTHDDALPNEEVSLVKPIERAARPQHLELEVRAPYGHGFSEGLVRYSVELDEQQLFEDHIGKPSEWHHLEAQIAPGTGTATLRVKVKARPEIGPGWWGRASTVLVREVELSPE